MADQKTTQPSTTPLSETQQGPLTALNLMGFIESVREQLKPPVGNANIYNDGGFMVTVVAGPNGREDYHIDPREEFFYQLQGDITLKIVEDGVFRDLHIREGEVFLLPPNVPHSPQRPAGTLGLVIEYARLPEEHDGLRWYCSNCGEVLFEDWFHLTDLTTQLQPVFDAFYGSEDKRTCAACGHVHPPRA